MSTLVSTLQSVKSEATEAPAIRKSGRMAYTLFEDEIASPGLNEPRFRRCLSNTWLFVRALLKLVSFPWASGM